MVEAKISFGVQILLKFYTFARKKSGKDYATSTNTDIYAYDLASGKTENWTEGMMGYDVNPSFRQMENLALAIYGEMVTRQTKMTL